MHFFTHAEPLPACLAAHMASEIQPLMVLSAAKADSGAKASKTAVKAATRFTGNLQGIGAFRFAFIILHRERFGKLNWVRLSPDNRATPLLPLEPVPSSHAPAW